MSGKLDETAAHRVDAFVDAAFAFAVTLLIIAGTEPLRSFADLGAALAHIPAFAMGFALVALFWSAHRAIGKLTPSRDSFTVTISLAIVFMVLIYVFPLRLMTESAMGWLTGGLLPGRELISSLNDLRGMFITYGLGFATLSGLYALLAHVSRRTAPDEAARTALGHSRSIWWMCTAAGLISAGLAALPLLAHMPWLPGFAYWLIPAGIGVYYWQVGKAERQSGAEA